MSSQPPLQVLIAVRPRLFASALGRLLDRDGREVTVIDPDAAGSFGEGYDVAVISDAATAVFAGAAVIRLANVEQTRPSSSVRIGTEHEIVPIGSAEDLAAVVDRAGMAVRGEPIA